MTIIPRTKLTGRQSYFKDIEASIPMLAAIQNSSINYNIHAYPTSFTFSTQIVLQTTNKGLPLNQLYLTEGIQKDSQITKSIAQRKSNGNKLISNMTTRVIHFLKKVAKDTRNIRTEKNKTFNLPIVLNVNQGNHYKTLLPQTKEKIGRVPSSTTEKWKRGDPKKIISNKMHKSITKTIITWSYISFLYANQQARPTYYQQQRQARPKLDLYSKHLSPPFRANEKKNWEHHRYGDQATPRY